MTASAITSAVPTAPRNAAAARGRAEGGDDAASPFASLLGSAEPAAPKPKAEAKPDEPARDDAGAASDAPATATAAELPAWLLALRGAPTADNAPAPAAASAGFADDGSDGTAKWPAGITALQTDPERLLRSRAGDTPPTRTVAAPSLPTTFAADATPTAAADAALPVLGAAPEAALDAVQVAALDAAVGKLAAATDAAVAAPAAVTATPRASIPEPATVPVAATPPDLGTLTDAFGEPLALDGQDTALRLGERLRWLNESGVQEARMQLHPRELGSVDVRIRIEGQAASVWFGAEHPAARAALEATLPQLRQQLAGEGFSLGEAQVGGQGAGTGPGGGEPRSEAHQSAFDSRLAGAATAGDRQDGGGQTASARLARGLVDRYA